MYAFIDEALYYAKGIAGLISAVAVALLTVYGPDTEVGHWLTVAVAVAGAISVYAVPNRTPAGELLVDPDGLLEDDDIDVDELLDHDGPVDNLEDPGKYRAEG